MKQFYGLTMMMVLLMLGVAMPAMADSYKGTLKRHSVKMEYSFSGCKLTKKDNPVLGANGAQYATHVYYSGEVKPGASISAMCKKLTGVDIANKKDVGIGAVVTTTNGKTRDLVGKEDDRSASASFTVPNDASEVTLSMACRSWNTTLMAVVELKVVKDNPAKQTTNSGTSVNAGTTFKDQVTHDGHTMKYSITGPTIKLKQKAVSLDNPTGKPGYRQEIEGYVKEGQTINVELEKISGSDTPEVFIVFDYTKKSAAPSFGAQMVKREKVDRLSKSYRVPSDAWSVDITIHYQIPHKASDTDIDIEVRLYTDESVLSSKSSSSSSFSSSSSSSTPSFKMDDVSPDENCPICKKGYSGFTPLSIRPSGNSTISRICKSTTKNSQKGGLMLRDAVYYYDYLTTYDREWLVLYYDDSFDNTLTVTPQSTVHCEPLANGNARWFVHKGALVGQHLKKVGNVRPELQLTNCAAYPKGTVYVAEDDGKNSRVYLLEGAMEVTSHKTKQKVNLQPGQMTTVTTNGQQNVQTFDVAAIKKKYEISASVAVASSSGGGDVFTVDKLNYKILSSNTVELTYVKMQTYKGHVRIPSTVTYQGKTYRVVTIGKKVFNDQRELTSVEIPSSVVKIEEDAFYNTGITQVTVPADNVRIDKFAFRSCRKLVTATVRGRTPSCSFDAFYGCSSMKELWIRDIKETSYGKNPNGTKAIIKRLQ